MTSTQKNTKNKVKSKKCGSVRKKNCSSLNHICHISETFFYRNRWRNIRVILKLYQKQTDTRTGFFLKNVCNKILSLSLFMKLKDRRCDKSLKTFPGRPLELRITSYLTLLSYIVSY